MGSKGNIVQFVGFVLPGKKYRSLQISPKLYQSTLAKAQQVAVSVLQPKKRERS